MVNEKPHVVIVGGGFGGVKAAERLIESGLVDVTLVSDRSNFWYYPSLYRTATGSPSQLSAIPLGRLFEGKKIEIVIDTATKINQNNKQIVLKSGKKLSYDYIILSLGVITNYFGIKGLKEYSYGIKSIAEADALKTHLHKQLVEDKKPDLHYVVVGGGPTGIELAGQLSLYLRHIMNKHMLPKRKIHVDLIEAAPRLLPRMDKVVGRTVARRLRELGVRLYLGESVKGETADTLRLGDKSLKSRTVIWTAGQANDPFFSDNHFALSERHKVLVDEFLQTTKNVFVIGDNAETQYSGLAQTAIYDAIFVAQNIVQQINGDPQTPYKPKKPVYVIPAGHHWAYVEWGRMRMYGYIGWLLREAGNIRGFMEIERPIDAGEQWLQEFSNDYNCSICES